MCVEHGGLANLAQAGARGMGLEPGQRVLQAVSLSFDGSAWSIYPALVAGAELHTAERDTLRPGPSLVGVLVERRINVWSLTPSLLAAVPDVELPDLTTIACAGDRCPAQLVDRWAPGRRFFNVYGPTEATVAATMIECRAGEGDPAIGRPLDHARVHLVTEGGEQAAPGEVGEIYIGGPGVARGYLDRPELTRERFVPDRFSGRPGARLYRTGDLGRRRTDGVLEFAGRADDQVKLRGYRIELGEVEWTLRQHAAVEEAVVVKRAGGGAGGSERLVAYVVPVDGAHVVPAALLDHLRQRVPAFMVPAQVAVLARLPLTPNLKVDRDALPIPGR